MLKASLLNTLEYDPELCIGCEMCTIVCPHAVFMMNDGKAEFARPEACMECGACKLNCPAGAIQVDSGVGCAAALMYAALFKRKEASCCGGSCSSSCS